MGIKDRKLKHKEQLRQQILEAAKTLFLTEGYEATSIRKIAAAIEFSPTTIYLYYKDKAEIAHALHQEGFKLFGQGFSNLQHINDAFERLKAMGESYIQFAVDNRAYYELMFVMREPLDFIHNDKDVCWAEGQQAFHFLTSCIQQCKEAGYFKNFDTETFALLIWSTMHGLCTLHLHGHMSHVVEQKNISCGVENAIHRTFEAFEQLLSVHK